MISLQPTRVQIVLNATLGLLGVMLYQANIVPPVIFSLVLFLTVFVIFVKNGFHGRVYSFFASVLCILPLLHTVGFVISDEYVFYPSFQKSLTDQLNGELRSRLALMGLVAMGGLLAGLNTGLMTRSPSIRNIGSHVSVQPKSSLPKIVLLALASLLIIRIDAPEVTIFRAAYTESISISTDQGFGSLFPVGFGLCAMAWYLYCHLKPSIGKTMAKYFLLTITAIIIVFFQLLRGDREFIGLAICLFFLADRYTTIHKKTIQLVLFSGCFFVILQFIGLYRSIAVEGVDLIDGLADYFVNGEFFFGTWTSVLLTPLATLGDYYHVADREFLMGRTYIDYILSIPPTPVANFFGYLRPITSEQGPAWDVSYGFGGTYVSVVPFFNFSMIGVFSQTFLIGLLIGTIDRKANEGSQLWTIFGFAIGIVLWGVFWYGEMYLLRAIVTTFPILIVIWYGLGMRNRRPAIHDHC